MFDVLRSFFPDASPLASASAPGRANLIGEHVDYAAGVSVPFAIGQRTRVEVGVLPALGGGLLHVVSVLEGGEVVRVSVPLTGVDGSRRASWDGYVVGTLWACQELGVFPRLVDVFGGVDVCLVIVSDVPVGGGLSSSAALECAVGVAMFGAVGQFVGVPAVLSDEVRRLLMVAAIRAENEVVGASTGGMDQRVSLFAREGCALAIDFGVDVDRQVPFDVAASGLCVLVCDTRAPHVLADGQYESRRRVIDGVAAATVAGSLRGAVAAGEDVFAVAGRWAVAHGEVVDVVLNRVRHVLEEIARAEECVGLLERIAGLSEPAGVVGLGADCGEVVLDLWGRVGELVSESHVSLRDLYEVSCPELDVAVDVALEEGALGARMIGGGFGGSTLALVREDCVLRVRDAIAEAFRESGFREPRFYVAVPGAGAMVESVAGL